MMQKNNYRLTLFLFLICFCLSYGQTKIRTDFSFKDPYGNKFLIKNIDILPKSLDTLFLKSNLTGAYFNKALTDTITRYDFTITDIKTIKKGKKYELTVYMIPLKSNLEEILKHYNSNHYRLTVKSIDNKLQINSIDWLFGEI